MIIGNTMENIGWAIIGNLHILFAAAIGGSWAKEKAGGAFAAIIAFILINRITGSIFGVTTDMLSQADATTYTLLGQTIPVKGYFVKFLVQPLLTWVYLSVLFLALSVVLSTINTTISGNINQIV